MLVGLCVVGTFGVTMVLSQLYLPRHVGVASGLSVGLAMGLGGVAAVALGAVADAVDLADRALRRRGAPALGCIACLLLPARRRRLRRRGRARAGRDRLGCRSIEPSVNEETTRMTVQEFFAALPEKADPAKTAGMHNTYVFDVEGVGPVDGRRRRRHGERDRGRGRRGLHDPRERGDAREDRDRARRTRRPPT